MVEFQTDEYAELVPSEVREVITRLDAIDKEIMQGALAERFFPVMRLRELLLETTAHNSFFSALFYKWKCILENREVDAYMQVKGRVGGTGEKFVHASAERESASAVNGVRYLVGVYEGNLNRCIAYVNTAKRLIEALETESNAQRGVRTT